MERLAHASVWLWFGGMVIFSNALHRLGLMGMPRRTMIGAAPYVQPEWQATLPLVAVGGGILFVSALLYPQHGAHRDVSRVRYEGEVPFAEALSGAEHAPVVFERWRPWLALAVILVVLAYGPVLLRLAVTTPLDAPGFRAW